MPIYEYQCDECGAEFQDLVMSRSGEADVACKSCQSQNVTKLLSGAAVKTGGGGDAVPAFSPKMGGGCGGGCSCH